MADLPQLTLTNGVPGDAADDGTVFTLGGVTNTEDNASASGDRGMVALAKRAAAPANTSGTDGDYEPLQVDGGRLWIKSKWSAGSGVGLTWTDIFSTATLNSIASTNGILSDLAISNGTALDKYMDVSIVLASAAFTGTGINISLHLYPLNSDGSTYGDGKFGSSAAGPCAYPPVATIPLVAATQAQTGSAVGIVMPPGTFKLVFVNNGGVALASSGNTCQYRTYN